jgi:hypothetical protein
VIGYTLRAILLIDSNVWRISRQWRHAGEVLKDGKVRKESTYTGNSCEYDTPMVYLNERLFAYNAIESTETDILR